MAEFSIIEEFCRNIGPRHADTLLGIGDDAAIVSVPDDSDLAISVDTMVSGVHFFEDVAPEHLAKKILAVNLSDMAAMGANPMWATLSLTLPKHNVSWLKAFSEQLKQSANRFSVELIGGDTCQGPLSLSLTIMGLTKKGLALTRHGARPGDDVYVSSFLGDAALGLAIKTNKVLLAAQAQSAVISALECPEPRVDLGLALVGVASACIDISDGLVGDLNHICQGSQVSIDIELERVPLSKTYKNYLDNGGNYDFALIGGDDYELAFTVPKVHRSQVTNLGQDFGLAIRRIGKVVASNKHAVNVRYTGEPYPVPTSFEHFSNTLA